jgi:hypothetical protein
MQQTVQQGGDAGGVGKDLVPFFECSVGGYDHGFAFVAAIDDFMEDVCRLIVERQVRELVKTSASGLRIPGHQGRAESGWFFLWRSVNAGSAETIDGHQAWWFHQECGTSIGPCR